jgi:hypothetical protein
MRLRRKSLGKTLGFNMYIVYSCLLNDISQERTKVRLHDYKYEKISIVACVSVAADTFLSCHCLSKFVFSVSTIPVFQLLYHNAKGREEPQSGSKRNISMLRQGMNGDRMNGYKGWENRIGRKANGRDA